MSLGPMAWDFQTSLRLLPAPRRRRPLPHHHHQQQIPARVSQWGVGGSALALLLLPSAGRGTRRRATLAARRARAKCPPSPEARRSKATRATPRRHPLLSAAAPTHHRCHHHPQRTLGYQRTYRSLLRDQRTTTTTMRAPLLDTARGEKGGTRTRALLGLLPGGRKRHGGEGCSTKTMKTRLSRSMAVKKKMMKKKTQTTCCTIPRFTIAEIPTKEATSKRTATQNTKKGPTTKKFLTTTWLTQTALHRFPKKFGGQVEGWKKKAWAVRRAGRGTRQRTKTRARGGVRTTSRTMITKPTT
mmetsp:Transcript_73639/g.148342  ORF Transcript_73639/g.148342 Transcript_73639/m.148342 type:complete len:300 (+) Transcript_73639:668-1567(+)